MGNRIKGITVTIGGDTTGLDKALKKTNTEIYNTQSQLKDVERLLKLDPKNTELLAQKNRLLGKAVGDTAKKLETLKAAEASAQEQFKKGDISQEQYEALQREIIETEQQLSKLERRAESSNGALKKASGAVESFSNAAGKAAQKTKAVSAVAAGAVTGLAGMAVKAGAAADDLNTLAKQSGFGTDEIQKWQYAADRMDVSSETIIRAAQKMKKNMNSTSKETIAAWDNLGVAVKDNDGNFRDATDVFYDTINALSQVPNETERDILAMQLFGKSADELAGIVDDGGAALKAMGEEAEQSGLILSQDALDGANAFNDGIDTLKAKATQAFFESGAALAESLLPLLDTLVEKLSGVLEWVGSLDGDTIKFIGTLLLLVAGISPVLKLISKVTGAISFLVANPMVAVVAAIIGLVAIIIKNADKIKAKLKEFAEFWKKIWTSVKQVFKGIFEGLVDLAKRPINSIIKMINKAINGINKLIRGVNRIPGINIGTIGNIPMLAKGGVVSSGSAIVGEAGPEILTVTAGRTIVQPLTSGAGGFGGSGNGIEGAINGLEESNTAGSTRIIGLLNEIQNAIYSIQIGDDTIAHAAQSYNRKLNVMNGGGYL